MTQSKTRKEAINNSTNYLLQAVLFLTIMLSKFKVTS